MSARITIVFALLLAIGCSERARQKSFAAANGAVLLAQGRALYTKYGARGGTAIPAAEWPPSFVALEPERVWADTHGIAIVTDQYFVETVGIFLRFDRSFVPPPVGDPGYEPIDRDVYWFEARG